MQPNLPEIRLATMEDFDHIMDMGMALHEENGILEADYDLMKNMALQGIMGRDYTMGVIGDIGHLEGMICLTIARYWYTHDFHLEELFTYVRPEHRRSNNAKALVNFAKTSAERLKLPLLIGIISNKDTARKVEMYKRWLGEPAGAYFLYNARTGK